MSELPQSISRRFGFSNTLALPQLVATKGLVPATGPEPAFFWLGMIHPFAGTMDAFGAPAARGQGLPIDGSTTALFALFQWSYGGDGKSTFLLPNLRFQTPVGDAPGAYFAATLGVSYIIAAESGGGAPVGSVAIFGGGFAPGGWLLCDGSAYSPTDYPDLAAVIGQTFAGGGGPYSVPNLFRRAAVGTGASGGLPPVSLGQMVPGQIPGLGLTPMICHEGAYPTDGSNGEDFPYDQPFIGQILFFAGQVPPSGWLPADGRLLPPASYPALSQVLGTTYGGDGTTSFALPDLRGRMMIGI